jgi:hypothetical protein
MGGRTFYLKGFYPTAFHRNVKNAGPKLIQLFEKTQLNSKIGVSIRGKINRVIRGKVLKKDTAEYFLGCTIEFFIGWIESKFKSGMSWGNRGLWHIDHIKPCNTFDLTKDEEKKNCFHYTNCRPLWAHENIARPWDGSDIVITEDQEKSEIFFA